MNKYLKRSFIVSVFFLSPLMLVFANDVKEKKESRAFDTLYKIETTSVKNQNRTGTCWDFATTSFIETELIRKGFGPMDISEMYFVHKIYPVKARRYVLLHGRYNFSQGGQAHDVMNAICDHGLVPESVYTGMNIEEDKHNHKEMDAVLKAMLKAVVSRKGGQITPRWPDAMEALLDAYLGKTPETFQYGDEKITPQQFAQKLDLNPDDYVELTSFSYYPFYEECILEVPDNWSMDTYYNLPIEDLMEVMYHAIEHGYSIVWDGDVSDKYFSHKNGVAFVPEIKWQKHFDDDLDDYLKVYQKEVDSITQKERDKTIFNQSTTDDHLMHLVGITKDQYGNTYFLTKNSWSEVSNDFGGYLNMSDKYMRLRTIAIMVHKDAIPKVIAKKIGLK